VPFSDLLRVTVLLAAGEATALAAVTVLAAGRDDDTTTLIVAAVWWTAALAIGLYLGRPSRVATGVRDALTSARTATSLPQETPERIALGRLWPIAASAVVAGGLGIFWPGVAAVACGYALLVAVAWRRREAAIVAIEERDAVRFYVEPGSALRPIQLIRTPGLGRDRTPPGHPPPPPPAAGD
jgi:hypothetical protein